MEKIKNTNYKKVTEIKYHKLVILILLTITATPIISGSTFNYLIFILSVGSIIFLLIFKSIQINYYIIWSIVILLIVILSITWSLDETLAFGKSKSYLLVIIVYIYLSLLIKNKKDVYTALNLFILSRFLMMIYIIFTVDASSLGTMRIGSDNLGEEWNANAIGMNLAFASYSSVVLLNKKYGIRGFYFLCLLLFPLVTVFTGSRKALFILFFSIILYSIFNSKKNILKKITFYLVFVFFSFYLLMNNEILYEILGSRMEDLVYGFFGDNNTDASTSTRKLMIESGLNFFNDKPLFGYGINNYRELLGRLLGDYRYSHNNYIELLVGIGLFGTIIYYLGFMFILLKALKNKSELSVFVLVSIISLLIIDYGLVSYNSYYIHFFICISFCSVFISQKNKTFN